MHDGPDAFKTGYQCQRRRGWRWLPRHDRTAPAANARQAAAHWPQGTVHFELFAPLAPAPHQPDQPFEIFLSRRKQTLTVPADQSILEVLRAAGVAIDYSCEAGICGTCRTRLISGEPDHRDQVLIPAEKAAKADIMVCISRAQPGQKRVLDI